MVRSDLKLAGGFNAVGLSQGGLVLRGYVERFNRPPIRTLVTVCAPHAGVAKCPAEQEICRLAVRWWPYTSPFAFSDYWKDVTDRDAYLSKSQWLADVNNERQTKNETYRSNMIALKRYVLVMALNDTIVIPALSEHHSFWKWGQSYDEEPLRSSEGYIGDYIGLRTLDMAGKLFLHAFVGGHLQFSGDFWEKTILPYLGEDI
eukprot:CAMPEP_0119349156 /NCGR_PEP_ID=MMETSP1333-20130426/109409_1 /TAXON_ID=418940 /ORGANISM="Scyphosphaera apsteinii, Strain RCC1455" /LENGTH=202 /DNA_ID=CAMNT_0007361751 /DNA_START=501 /DNA_END=1109 /DNA_ORIENTATION=-